MSDKINPLKNYFREPGMYTKIPSCGHFYDLEDVEFTPTMELAIYPMTAYDELLLKNPDALLNGDAMKQIVMSCVPSIQSTVELTSPDMDVLMLAIRAVSYGDTIEYETKCPHCKEDNSFAISIRYALESINFHEKEYAVKLSNEITAYIRPRSYATNTKAAIMAFEQTKITQSVIAQENIPTDDKNKILRQSFDTVAKFNIEMIADSIIGIEIPQGLVTDRDMILEWVKETESRNIKELDKKIDEITAIGVEKEQILQCPSCSHEWKSSVLFDPSYFFV